MIFNRKDKDVLFTDETKRHILVIHKGNFYAFDVLNENGIESLLDFNRFYLNE